MAKKQAAKTKPRETVPQAGAAGDVAQAIGESLADLMNRKDALVRQLADVNQRIASASQAGRRLLASAPNFMILGRSKTGVAKKTRAAGAKTGKRKRPAIRTAFGLCCKPTASAISLRTCANICWKNWASIGIHRRLSS